VSTAYVVDDKMRFMGIITIDNAIRARNNGLSLPSLIDPDVHTCNEDTLINDIISLAAEAKYPLAVLDKENKLKGIISKATVLASL
ncbi:MAG: CBS domain-containing protein, partial [Firmicutes bacterium]|nr:CBS domain-containing protein [Bacillota bacterium]